jgi:uncharacterized Zn-finger protein
MRSKFRGFYGIHLKRSKAMKQKDALALSSAFHPHKGSSSLHAGQRILCPVSTNIHLVSSTATNDIYSLSIRNFILNHASVPHVSISCHSFALLIEHRCQLEDVSVWRDGVVKIWRGQVNVARGRCVVYICGLCGLRSSKSSNAVIHVRSHTGEKPFSCHQCNCLFARKQDLKRHVLSVHRAQFIYMDTGNGNQ